MPSNPNPNQTPTNVTTRNSQLAQEIVDVSERVNVVDHRLGTIETNLTVGLDETNARVSRMETQMNSRLDEMKLLLETLIGKVMSPSPPESGSSEQVVPEEPPVVPESAELNPPPFTSRVASNRSSFTDSSSGPVTHLVYDPSRMQVLPDHPNSETLADFLVTCRKDMRVLGCSTLDMLLHSRGQHGQPPIALKLDPRPGEIFEKKRPRTWKQFVRLMGDELFPQNVFWDDMQRLFKRRIQRKGEPINTYYSDLLRLAEIALARKPHEDFHATFLQRFVEGLRPPFSAVGTTLMHSSTIPETDRAHRMLAALSQLERNVHYQGRAVASESFQIFTKKTFLSEFNSPLPVVAATTPSASMGKERLCWVCQNPGHFARECPKVKKTISYKDQVIAALTHEDELVEFDDVEYQDFQHGGQ